MPIELTSRFSVSASGGISVTSDPDRQINQHVDTLLATEPGERRGNYAYGVPTRSMLFENGSHLVGAMVTQQVRDKLGRYEPGVVINTLNLLDDNDSNGQVRVALNYTRRESPLSPSGLARNTNTAVISVGGTVDEVIRG